MADTVDYFQTPPPPLVGQLLSAAHAAEISAALRASRIYAGPGIRISRTPDGATISAAGTTSSGCFIEQSPRMPVIGTVISFQEDGPQYVASVRLANGSQVKAYCLNATYSTRILSGTKVILYPVQIKLIPGSKGEESGAETEEANKLFFFRSNLCRNFPFRSSGYSGDKIFVNTDNALFCITDPDLICVSWDAIDPPDSAGIQDSGKSRILYSNSLEISLADDVLTPQESIIEGFPAWYGRQYGIRWRNEGWIIYPYTSGPNPSSWKDWMTGEVIGDGWWESSDLYNEFSPAGADAENRNGMKLSVGLGKNLIHQGDNAEGDGSLFGTYKEATNGEQITVGVQMYIDSYKTGGRTWSIENGALQRRDMKVKRMQMNGSDGFGFKDPRVKGVTFWSDSLPNKSDVVFTPYEMGEDGLMVPANDVDSLNMTYKGFGPGILHETSYIWVLDSVQLI